MTCPAHDAQRAKSILEQLVRIRTTQPVGDEKDAVLFLQDIFRPHPVEMTVIEHSANRASLLVTLPGKNRSRSVALCGHLDTVAVEPGELWEKAPFSAFFDGERLFGRGAADMKGGLTSIVLAALSFLEGGARLENDVQLCFTADEEVGGMGASALCDCGALDRVQEMVVVKPTSGRVVLAEKGALWLDVSAVGLSAHAARPEQGVNAVEQISAFARSISAILRKEGKYPLLGYSTCVVTTLNGGVRRNVVPSRVEACFDIRTSPSFSHGSLMEKIAETAWAQMQKNPPLKLEFRVRVERPALGMSENAPLVRAFTEVFKTLKLPWETAGMSYFTDASVFVPKLGVPFVIFGPGDEKFFHQADEYIALESVLQAAQVLKEYLRGGTVNGSA